MYIFLFIYIYLYIYTNILIIYLYIFGSLSDCLSVFLLLSFSDFVCIVSFSLSLTLLFCFSFCLSLPVSFFPCLPLCVFFFLSRVCILRLSLSHIHTKLFVYTSSKRRVSMHIQLHAALIFCKTVQYSAKHCNKL